MSSLHIGDSVRAIGNVVPSTGYGQALELQASELLQLGACDPAVCTVRASQRDPPLMITPVIPTSEETAWCTISKNPCPP